MQLATVQRKSSDLNPIENVWGYIKNIVQARVPQNLDELNPFVQEAFKESITPEYCNRLYNSIPRRLNLVIKKKALISPCSSIVDRCVEFCLSVKFLFMPRLFITMGENDSNEYVFKMLKPNDQSG